MDGRRERGTAQAQWWCASGWVCVVLARTSEHEVVRLSAYGAVGMWGCTSVVVVHVWLVHYPRAYDTGMGPFGSCWRTRRGGALSTRGATEAWWVGGADMGLARAHQTARRGMWATGSWPGFGRRHGHRGMRVCGLRREWGDGTEVWVPPGEVHRRAGDGGEGSGDLRKSSKQHGLTAKMAIPTLPHLGMFSG
ncbi:hypothetical protein FIBSPDRAFT_886029 [Athelia psychrophila]|uniref:Uncharacterized protein n=1 Tax=Athelia psychrophila TaxID=1759441 RepID=A0A166RDB5_9AGAM|nr:hypothetical protein FIBSPDRAFT_886029 [Fibularhizoctonia sp. CBS 109695]